MVQAKQSLKLSEKEYVSHLITFPQHVVAGLTNGAIVSVPVTLDNKLTQVYTPTTAQQAPLVGLHVLPTLPNSFVTCDTLGKLKIFDTRQKTQLVNSIELKLPVTACGVSNFGEISIGTEASPDAQIQVFDIKKLQSGAVEPVNVYKDSHNDDVTDLQFHPTIPHVLASGSTDGVVNLFDLNIKNEDEAVNEAFNLQASVHRIGFFMNSDIKGLSIKETSKDRLFALSHMETLSVYPLNDEESKEGIEEYGDLREKWECQYVCDFENQHFLTGSNDEGWAKLVPIVDLKPQTPILLEGGHGTEVIRTFGFWNLSNACYTGGEDGCIKLWDLSGDFDDVAKFADGAHKDKQRVGKAVKKSKRTPY